MKLKVNWKKLGKQLWDAVKPVLLAAIGGGLVTLANGCSSLTPSAKTQTMSWLFPGGEWRSPQRDGRCPPTGWASSPNGGFGFPQQGV